MSRGDFWSRRQAAVAAEAKAEQRAQTESDAAAREAEVAEQSDAEILAALELPDPESLVEGDDFKVFLTDQVPARIKTRALRHLWRANPVLACVDGLVDYGEDFTDAACVIEGLQTAYQVGKGMTKHVEALAQEAEAERIAAETQPTAKAQPEPEAHRSSGEEAAPPDDWSEAEGPTLQQAETQADDLAAAQAGLDDDAAQAGETQNAAAPRRMRFSFEGAAT